ncbi:MAG: ATP-binding protein [Oscillospiraceae bacterium]|nr:ATP-binding protein [Oscillospiraceae bacterium]
MENKITMSMMLLGICSVALAILLTGVIFHRSFQLQMESDTKYIADTIAADYDTGTPAASVSKYGGAGTLITLVSPGGDIIYDNGSDVDVLSDPELKDAVSSGSGSDSRYSESKNQDIYYRAVELRDGNILRVGIPARTLKQAFAESSSALISIAVMVMLFAAVMALMLTNKLVKPINNLASQIDDPTLSSDESRVYRELAPFVQEIQDQRRRQENMRQEFTANVSHELKTPLTSISGYAELIENGMAKEEDIRRFGGIIRKEAGRMLLLISDIIRLSELDAGGEKQPKEPVDLAKTAQECVNMLKESAQKHGVEITLKSEPSSILGNGYQVWELIYNLIDNAIRYNREGGKVNVMIERGTVTVEDNGIGIPKEHQNRIFERFYRVDKSHSRETGGTGLGLSIVKHIAEIHNAYIFMESAEGEGTKISVTFPARIDETSD